MKKTGIRRMKNTGILRENEEIQHTANILYKPYCSICEKPIEEDVKLIHIFTHDEKFIIPAYTTILPVKCKHCGRVFKTIEIPLKEENEIEDLKR